MVQKREDVSYALIGSCWPGKAGGKLNRSGHLMWLFWGAYLVSFGLVSEEKVSSHCLSPDCSRPIAAEVLVWLPRLVVAKVTSQSSVTIYDLAIVYLYVQFLYPHFWSFSCERLNNLCKSRNSDLPFLRIVQLSPYSFVSWDFLDLFGIMSLWNHLKRE